MRIAHLADSFRLRAEVTGRPGRRAPLHGHPEHHLLRVTRYGEPRCAEQSRRSGRARARADRAGDRLPGS